MATAKNIDAYIATFPEGVQQLLEQMRRVIQQAAPAAEETINYGIPTFILHGNLVHYAGYKNHIGFYPAPSGIEAFKKALSMYPGAKGSVQFPLHKPLPVKLITKIVQFRVKENIEKSAKKKDSKVAVKKAGERPALKSNASKQKSPVQNNLFAALSAPAKRALENNGIHTLQELAAHTEAAILSFHGIGPSSIPKLRNALQAAGLAFKQ